MADFAVIWRNLHIPDRTSRTPNKKEDRDGQETLRPVADERQALLGFLEQQRYVVAYRCLRPDDEQARATPTPSALSVGGIIKHLAAVERSWMDTVMQRHQASRFSGRLPGQLPSRPGRILESVLDDYAEAARETTEIIEAIADLGQAVPVPKDVPVVPEGRGRLVRALGAPSPDRPRLRAMPAMRTSSARRSTGRPASR